MLTTSVRSVDFQSRASIEDIFFVNGGLELLMYHSYIGQAHLQPVLGVWHLCRLGQ